MQNTGAELILQGTYLQQLWWGLWVTAHLAGVSLLFSAALGTLFGFVRLSKNKIVVGVSQIYLESMRIIPVLVWLFIFYFGLARTTGISLSGETVAVVVFTLWGTAELGELLRGAVTSLPRHQIESARALGLSHSQVFYHVLLPQALKRVLPGAVNLATRMIKTTSLVVMIGVTDVVKVGRQIVEVSTLKQPTAPFWIYGFIFMLYFALCYPLSYVASKLEKRKDVFS